MTDPREIYKAGIESTTFSVMKFDEFAGTLPWEELREKRSDISDAIWKRLLDTATLAYGIARKRWDAEHIPGGTSLEIEQANYDTHPMFMDYLNKVVAEFNTKSEEV